MCEEKNIINVVPTDDGSQNAEEENTVNAAREVIRRQVHNSQFSDTKTVRAETEGNFDHVGRQGDKSDFLKQLKHSEGSSNIQNVNHGPENNSFNNIDNYVRSYENGSENLSHTNIDCNRQTGVSNAADVLVIENHFESFGMAYAYDMIDYEELSNTKTCFLLGEKKDGNIHNFSVFNENNSVICEEHS